MREPFYRCVLIIGLGFICSLRAQILTPDEYATYLKEEVFLQMSKLREVEMGRELPEIKYKSNDELQKYDGIAESIGKKNARRILRLRDYLFDEVLHIEAYRAFSILTGIAPSKVPQGMSRKDLGQVAGFYFGLGDTFFLDEVADKPRRKITDLEADFQESIIATHELAHALQQRRNDAAIASKQETLRNQIAALDQFIVSLENQGALTKEARKSVQKVQGTYEKKLKRLSRYEEFTIPSPVFFKLLMEILKNNDQVRRAFSLENLAFMLSLKEGEANLIALLTWLTSRNESTHNIDVRANEMIEHLWRDTEKDWNIPQYFMFFPYTDGFRFMTYLYQKGMAQGKPWQFINDLEDHPPLNLREVAYPQEYVDRIKEKTPSVANEPISFRSWKNYMRKCRKNAKNSEWNTQMIQELGMVTWRQVFRNWGLDDTNIYETLKNLQQDFVMLVTSNKDLQSNILHANFLFSDSESAHRFETMIRRHHKIPFGFSLEQVSPLPFRPESSRVTLTIAQQESPHFFCGR